MTVGRQRELARLRRITLKSLSERVERVYQQMLWHREETQKVHNYVSALLDAQHELADAYEKVFGVQIGEKLLAVVIDPRLTSIGDYDG